MGRLLGLDEFRHRKQGQAAFALWPRRLQYRPQPGVSPRDLPGQVLDGLCGLDQNATLAVYDLVLGVRGWGRGEDFADLEPAQKEAALDAFLFLVDQMRFEVMRRLGWVDDFPPSRMPLARLADAKSADRQAASGQLPRLLPAHPRFKELEKGLQVEPGAVIRSLIPEALEEFKKFNDGLDGN